MADAGRPAQGGGLRVEVDAWRDAQGIELVAGAAKIVGIAGAHRMQERAQHAFMCIKRAFDGGMAAAAY